MRIPSLIGLILGFLGLIGCIFGLIFFKDIFLIEEKFITLTSYGKIVIAFFLVSVASFIFSIWGESHQAHREMTKTFKAVKNQYDEIAKKFMIYLGFKILIKSHFDHLKELYSISEKYEVEPNLKSLFEKYLMFWFNNFVDTDISKCRDHLLNFTLELESVV